MQRDAVLAKIDGKQAKVSEKIVLDAFLKKSPLPDNSTELLVKALPKHWLEKLKITNHTKVSKLFEDLDCLVGDAVQRLPSQETISSVLYSFTSVFKYKLQKKIISEVDVCMAAIVTHFKNYKSQLDRSPPMEGISIFEGEHVWGDKDNDRCSYAKAGSIRDALVERFTEVINLDFPKLTSKSSRSVIIKLWDTKQSSIILANLNHAMAIDSLIRETILPITSSKIYKLRHDFGISKLVSKLYWASMKLTVKMVC